MLDGSTKPGVTSVFLVTLAIIEGGLILLVDDDSDLGGQHISQLGKLTQIGTQDDNVTFCRVTTLSRNKVSL